MSKSVPPCSACHTFSLGNGVVLPLDDSRASKRHSEASTTASNSSSSGEMRSDDDCESDAEPAAAAAALPAPSTKNVRFGVVKLRSHNVILGDNPSVSKGPPVALDWNAVASDHLDLDEYEQEKLNKCYETDSCHENKKASRIPVAERYKMVRAAGHSRGSLLRAQEEIRAIKKHRQRTAASVAETPAAGGELEPRSSHPAPFVLRWIANRRAARNKNNNGGRPRQPNPNRCV